MQVRADSQDMQIKEDLHGAVASDQVIDAILSLSLFAIISEGK